MDRKSLGLLQGAYRKTFVLPSNLALHLEAPLVNKDNVYLGVISGTEVRRLYEDFGDALFLENIREFIVDGGRKGRGGTDREKVNGEIVATIQESPGKLLERNNGITFKAESVTIISPTCLELNKASIVNGCQTTMCIVHWSSEDHPCFVLVKVVQTQDYWDVAKAANYQNSITKVDLDLAQFLRPQLVRKYAMDSAVQVERAPQSAVEALNLIYREKITYEEVRSLYIGFFSGTPNNVFETDWYELRTNVVEKFHGDDELRQRTFDVLFKLALASQEGLLSTRAKFAGEEYANLFQRLFKEDKPQYKAFWTILAACEATRTNLSERKKVSDEFKWMDDFFSKVKIELEQRRVKFLRAFELAFKSIAQDVISKSGHKPQAEILQNMADYFHRCDFDALYSMLCLNIDDDANVRPASL